MSLTGHFYQSTCVSKLDGKHPRLPSDSHCFEFEKAVKIARAVAFIGSVENAVAKANVCLQAAQQRQKKYAEYRTESGEMAWSLSRLLESASCYPKPYMNGLNLQDPCSTWSSQPHSEHCCIDVTFM